MGLYLGYLVSNVFHLARLPASNRVLGPWFQNGKPGVVIHCMVDSFELLCFNKKTNVLLETGGRILAYLGTLLGLLGRILGPSGGLSGTTLLFFHKILWSFLGLLGQCWDNINCGNPKAPHVENPQIGTHPGWGGPRTPDSGTYIPLHSLKGIPGVT